MPTQDQSAQLQPQRKELILTAALRTIARDGVAGLSLRTVATQANVALGSIAYYFTDKDGLISAAFHDFAQRSVEQFRSFTRVQPLWKKLAPRQFQCFPLLLAHALTSFWVASYMLFPYDAHATA